MPGVRRPQPVPFSHQHHVAGLGIDCRYCHTSVETSSFAGIPPTKTCMNCHAQIWTNAALLEPVRESYKTGKSLVWTRVNDLPDFAYFNHSIHINKGVGCNTCHGPVDRMPLMYNQASLQMEWCLECHRAPEKNLRPRDQVFNMRYEQPSAAGMASTRPRWTWRRSASSHTTSCSTARSSAYRVKTVRSLGLFGDRTSRACSHDCHR